MARPGALRDLTLALGAAVAALGSLLFIAWKICFRGIGTGTDWGGWWERELRELRDRAPAGDADPLYREPLTGISPIPTGQGRGRASGSLRVPHTPETVKLGKGQGLGIVPGVTRLGKALDRQQDPSEHVGLGKGAQGQDPLGSRTRIPPEPLDWRQVLVLGLDGAGKSSVLHYLCSQTARERIAPTRGFNSAQLYVEGLEVDLLEVGGSQNLRAYWPHYLSQAHVLVFVVDSVDRARLLTARQELHSLLAAEPQLPLVVLANKQDKSNALSVAELQEELALHTLGEQRELFLLPTSATWASLSTATSVLHVKSLLVTLLSQP
ncbi:hypothetical protein QYF61_006560 [Mycteria americana]|uniref:ARL10 protein n=1 Tax=Mycteria americana TaxID=33587 RepID=A0AAN7S0I8_MYCAM|nr:hypothetical protein QYF61_006560 [Mycteria americana]